MRLLSEAFEWIRREAKTSFIVCIPTFKRPQLLGRLIDDLLEQSVKASIIVVVDGDPELRGGGKYFINRRGGKRDASSCTSDQIMRIYLTRDISPGTFRKISMLIY